MCKEFFTVMMRASWYERTGPAGVVLQIGERAIPDLAPGAVLVRIRASGVNPSDTKMRAGWRGAAMAFPLVVPHADGAGDIVAVGEGVDPACVGSRVWVYNATALYDASRAFGTAAQYCALPASQARELPKEVSYLQGACWGVPACTAHRAVFADGAVAGRTLLVQGGAGCVGHYAIQFAKLGGARVIATVSSAEKAAHALSGGADAVVDYTREDVVARVLDLTGQQGVDRIVEVDFGANLGFDVALVRPNGFIASYSSTAVPEPVFPYYALAYKGVTLRLVQGFNLPSEARSAAVQDICRWSLAGHLQHAIGAVFDLADIARAHEAVEQRAVIGNVVVRID